MIPLPCVARESCHTRVCRTILPPSRIPYGRDSPAKKIDYRPNLVSTRGFHFLFIFYPLPPPPSSCYVCSRFVRGTPSTDEQCPIPFFNIPIGSGRMHAIMTPDRSIASLRTRQLEHAGSDRTETIAGPSKSPRRAKDCGSFGTTGVPPSGGHRYGFPGPSFDRSHRRMPQRCNPPSPVVVENSYFENIYSMGLTG